MGRLLGIPIRLFLLLYMLLPIIAIGILFFLVQQIYADIEPVVTTASTEITNAAGIVEEELSDLGENFEPLVNAVNGIRNALNSVISFLRGTINSIINWAEGACSFINPFGDCSWSGIGTINLPNIVDLSFLDRIGDSFSTIAENMNAVTSTMTSAFVTYQLMILAAFGIMVLWAILTYFLLNMAIYRSLTS